MKKGRAKQLLQIFHVCLRSDVITPMDENTIDPFLYNKYIYIHHTSYHTAYNLTYCITENAQNNDKYTFCE